MPQLRLLSVVFSFRNEEAVLAELIRRTRAVLSNEKINNSIANWELIFVNDASSDQSLEILTQEAKNHKDIRIVNLSRTFGVAAGIMAGFAHSKGDAVVYLDADLQDPPEVISQMIHVWQTNPGADIVHTVRRRRKGESYLKLQLTKMGYWVLNRISYVQLPQEAGDFKLLTRRVVNHLLQLHEHSPFVRGLICWVGFKQTFVDYERQPRYGGESKMHILGRKVLSNFFDSALIAFSSLPLKIASILGSLVLLIDGVFSIYLIKNKMSGIVISPMEIIILVMLFVGAIQLLCLGFLGHYLNAIFEQGKNRPLYIVESTLGFPPHD